MTQDMRSERSQGGSQPQPAGSDAELLRLKGPYLEVISTLALERDGDLTVFLDSDPQIIMLVKPSGSHLARLEVDHDPNVTLGGPILYVDYGEGFSQSTALSFRQDGRGRLSCALGYPDRLVKLRFDPDSEPGAVRFERIEFVPFSLATRPNGPDGADRTPAYREPPDRAPTVIPLAFIHQINTELNAVGVHKSELLILDRLYPQLPVAALQYILSDDDAELTLFLKEFVVRGWYASAAAVKADTEYLARSAEFDYDYYELQLQGTDDAAIFRSAPATERRRRLIKHYLLRGTQRGLQPSRRFEPGFYSDLYADEFEGGYVEPFVHYLRQGRHERRYPRRTSFETAVKDVVPLIDADFYLLRAGLKLTADAAEHYVREGSRHDIWPRPDFSPSYYAKRNPDVTSGDADPLIHYVHYGRREGRRGHPDLSGIRVGQAPFSPLKPTVLIASHEGSRTGAPFVGLALAEQLSAEFNVVTHLGRPGPLEDRFARVSTAIAVAPFDTLDAEYFLRELINTYNLTGVITNSIESHAICIGSLRVDLPCVALVHEFAEYTTPAGKTASVLLAADRVIVPATLVRASIDRECVKYFNHPPRHLHVRAQGYIKPDMRSGEDDLTREGILELARSIDGSPRRIVLGGGFVHVRKGVDLFLETAAEMVRSGRRDLVFIWVGGGYLPETDIEYSLWLREMIERMKLTDVVRFLPAQKSFRLMLELCDVFYLPSRLDPFPNVVIDALFADKAVVCFKDGTGVDELFLSGWAKGDAAPYCDVPAAARAIAAWLDNRSDRGVQDLSRLAERFDFADYAAEVVSQLRQAQAERRGLVQARDRLLCSGAFDPAFHDGDPKAWGWSRTAATDYVAKALKGFVQCNPRPGFNDGVYRAAHPELGAACVPLLSALDDGDALTTHICARLESRGVSRLESVRVAVHVHLHYPDTAAAILERLQRLRHPVDVFITTAGRGRSVQIEAAFRDFDLGEIELIDVPNRGRDIGPFASAVLPRVASATYDIIGHFHSKKTLSAGPNMGAAWRNYLFDTLLGNADDFLTLTARFAADAQLGLVFAEDRHAVGWSQNFKTAQDLAARLELQVKLPAFPIFPIGTMFWARPAALAPLSGALQWTDYPPEPLDPDGTVLHALERLLPSICRSQGYKWETVYRPGTAW